MQSSGSDTLRELCRAAASLVRDNAQDDPQLSEARRVALADRAAARDGGNEAKEPPLGWLSEARLLALEDVQCVLLLSERPTSPAVPHGPIPLLSMADRVSLRQLVDQVIMDLRRRTDGLLRLDDAEIAVHNPVCMAVDDVALRLLALSLPGSQVATPADEAPAASTNPTATTTSTFISTHLRTTPILVPIVAAALLLGWARATGPAAYAHLRKATLELLGSLPPAECFALLGNVVRVASVGGRAQQQRVRSAPRVELLHHGNEGDKTPPSWPVHVLQTAQILMGRQLAAPGGIKGLMINLFGTELGRNEVIDPTKLDHLAALVARVPVGLEPTAYLASTAAQLRRVIAPPPKEQALPDQYVHAACHVAVRLLLGKATGSAFANALLGSVHAAFAVNQARLSVSAEAGSEGDEYDGDDSDGVSTTVIVPSSNVTDALALLLPLLTHAPPSAPLLALALQPVLAQFLALHLAVAKNRTADPLLVADLSVVLRSWGRAVDAHDGARAMVRCVTSGRGWGRQRDGREFFWSKAKDEVGQRSVSGVPYAVCLRMRRRRNVLRTGTSRSPGIHAWTQLGANISDLDGMSDMQALADLDLEPDPDMFVKTLASLEHPELVALFLVEVLALYQSAVQHQQPPRETLLYLRLIMLICESESASIFKEPQHMLVFVEEALRGDDVAPKRTSPVEVLIPRTGSQQRDPDSDDEEEDALESSVPEQNPEQMGLIETAISLFSAIIAGNGSLDIARTPLVQPIERHLKRLSKSTVPELRQGAAQALLLLAVKKASSVSQPSQLGQRVSRTRQDYQEALKLLRDPLLPVRAHGLIILQDVVKAKDFERALVPGILDVFLRSIEDDDSFMYLNAVKGLSSMVDGIGTEIFAQLVATYSEGLSAGTSLTAQDLDRRLRLGEALLQSVKRSGQTFGAYANLVVPPIIRIFPTTSLATVLRSSALSILTACFDADWRAVLPWTHDLLSACTDLVQLESVPVIRERKLAPPAPTDDKTSDREPTKGNDGKHPALRRAALVLLGTVFDTVARSQLEEAERGMPQSADELTLRDLTLGNRIITAPRPLPASNIDAETARRARTVIRYVAETDEDDLVRFQAGEVLQLMDVLATSAFGIST